jgi:hypothetical protein
MHPRGVVDLSSIAGHWPDTDQSVGAWPQPEMTPRDVDPLAWYIENKPKQPDFVYESDPPRIKRLPRNRLPHVQPRTPMRMLPRPVRQRRRVRRVAGRTVSRRANAPPHLSSSDDDPPLNRTALLGGAV